MVIQKHILMLHMRSSQHHGVRLKHQTTENMYLKYHLLEHRLVITRKKISRLIKEHLGEDIFVYFSSCKVGSFFSLKSKTPFALKARVVYKFKCLSDSDNTYIGKTERHITTRAKEHLYHKGSNPSAVTTHIAGCEACKTGQLSVVNFSIVKQCRNDYRCKITESLIIKNENPALNKQRHNKGQSYLLRVF